MTSYLNAVPAYGRGDYPSKKAIMADWNAGLDFRIDDMFSPENGRYVNKADKPADVTLNVRYKSNTMVALIK